MFGLQVRRGRKQELRKAEICEQSLKLDSEDQGLWRIKSLVT